MRYKPKGKKVQIFIICIAIVAVVIAQHMGFSSTRTATRILFSTNEGWYTWSANYALLHGDLTRTIHAEQTPDILYINIETESGEIAITVKDMDGNLIFRRDNIPTSSFCGIAKQPVLSAKGKGADGVLCQVVGDRHLAVR